ncbi:hypothetical protein BJY04DRAFT_190368 [Aspergillus karnatakaensis]|uniref:uncharacterized protein n=1 Tax=Aspergillus karnatakaensis TaxID=1810916 RepID=UPI003CCE49E3
MQIRRLMAFVWPAPVFLLRHFFPSHASVEHTGYIWFVFLVPPIVSSGSGWFSLRVHQTNNLMHPTGRTGNNGVGESNSALYNWQ